MNGLEREVMEFLLRGDFPFLAMLRQQLAVAKVTGREMTGVGFFTDFEVPAAVPRLAVDRPVLDDVHADVAGLQYGAGFVLFIEQGALRTLEAYIYEDAWPAGAKINRLYYMRHERPDGGNLVETTERELTAFWLECR